MLNKDDSQCEMKIKTDLCLRYFWLKWIYPDKKIQASHKNHKSPGCLKSGKRLTLQHSFTVQEEKLIFFSIV